MSSSPKVSERTVFPSWIWQSEFTRVRVSQTSEVLWPSSLIFFSHASLLERWGARCKLHVFFAAYACAHADRANMLILSLA